MPQPPNDRKNEDTPASRLDLNKMYPRAKSFDELAHEREETDRLHAQRAPKHVILLIGLKIYSILIGFALALTISFAIIPTNIIAGVFLSFFIGLVWLGYTVWMLTSISNSFQRFGFSAEPFFQLYALVYSILACASYYFVAHISLVIFLTLATCLHFILVYVLLRTKLKAS
ncbi:MAG TPA: hypothetical protein VK497_06170 [Candidatus Saccharimonadales bacterium]|nr:hypothetical protein [Candidatus Saccharimonadales bacterium]